MTILFKHSKGCPRARLGTNERKTEERSSSPQKNVMGEGRGRGILIAAGIRVRYIFFLGQIW